MEYDPSLPFAQGNRDQAGAGVPQSREECRRSDRGGREPGRDRVPDGVPAGIRMGEGSGAHLAAARVCPTPAPAFMTTSCRICSIPSSPRNPTARARPGAGRQDHPRPWRRHDRLPLGEPPDDLPRPSSDGRTPGRAATPAYLLIADDDSAIRTVLTQAFGRAGYNVWPPAMPRRCGVGWRRGRAAVVTDVVLPDESGFDLLPRLKSAAAAAGPGDERQEHHDDGDHRGRARRL